MSSYLNQSGCHGTHGTIIGGESLIKLGHHPTDRRFIINQINLYSRFRQIECGLHSADPAAQNHGGTNLSVFCFVFMHFLKPPLQAPAAAGPFL